MNPAEPKDIRSIMLDGTRVQQAARASWIKTLDQHRRLGNPIVVWRDGKVVWIPAEDIEVPEAERDESHTNPGPMP